VLTLLVVAVGAAMVGRGYHYPSDTIGAVGVALAVVLLVALVALVVDAAGDRARAADPATRVSPLLSAIGERSGGR
jgi:undecaprenyl-diphosphatase